MPGPETTSLGMNSAGTTLWVASWFNPPPPNGGLLAPVALFAPGMALGGGEWVALPEMIDGDGVETKPSVTKLGHLRSPGKAEEKVPGRKDSNQWTAQFNYQRGLMTSLTTLVPGSATNPDTALNNWARKSFFLELPDRAGWWFQGFLAGNPVRVPEDDRTTLNITIEISGAPVWRNLG